MSDGTSPQAGRGARLQNLKFMAIGAAALPVLLLLAPLAMTRAIRKVLFSPNLKSLSEPEFADQITYTTTDASPMQDRHAEVKELVAELVEDCDWSSLSDLIEEWDQNRTKCPSGYALAPIAANHVVALLAGDDGLEDEDCRPMAQSKIASQLVDKFEFLAASRHERYPLAALAVLLRLRQAWDLRGGGFADSVPDAAWPQIDAHYEKAAWLLDTHDPVERNSPLLAEVRFALCDHMDSDEVASKLHIFYDDWAGLDLADQTSSEHYAFKLLPRWYGTYDALEVAARAAAGRAQTLIGNVPYAAFYLATAPRDDGALYHMDMDLFADGMRDLMKLRGPDPAFLPRMIMTVLELANDCNHIAGERRMPKTIRATISDKEATLKDLARELARKHLTSIHPSAWPYGTEGALDVISELFQDELVAGATFAIDADGLSVTMPVVEEAA